MTISIRFPIVTNIMEKTKAFKLNIIINLFRIKMSSIRIGHKNSFYHFVNKIETSVHGINFKSTGFTNTFIISLKKRLEVKTKKNIKKIHININVFCLAICEYLIRN